MLRIALCDDDPAQLELLEHLIQSYIIDRNLKHCQILAFSSAQTLLTSSDPHQYDLYLLDVVMPEQNGIDLGKNLRNLGAQAPIIYLTTSREFAVDSYEIHAFHYLVKPVEPEKLFSVLDQALAGYRQQETHYIVAKTKEATLRIPLKDIMYAELYSRTIRYHLADGQMVSTITLREPFQAAMAMLLEHDSFVLCGASYVVNLAYVSAMQKEGAMMKDGSLLILPKSGFANLKAAWLTYWLGDTP